MEAFIDSQHGTAVLLASIVIALCLNLAAKIGEWVFKSFEKKTELSESNIKNLANALNENSQSLNNLVIRMDALDKDLSDVVKYKKHIQHLFTAVKALAGERWEEIRKTIINDDLNP